MYMGILAFNCFVAGDDLTLSHGFELLLPRCLVYSQQKVHVLSFTRAFVRLLKIITALQNFKT